MDFETNLNKNASRKELKYHSLLTDLSNDYHTIEFVNVFMSCLSIFSQSSEPFIKLCTELSFDNNNLHFIIYKLSTIIIHKTYYIFCIRSKSWCNPNFSVIEYTIITSQQLLYCTKYSMVLSLFFLLLSSIVVL